MLKFNDKNHNNCDNCGTGYYQRLLIQVEGIDNVLRGQTSCGSSYIRHDRIERLND